MSQRPVACLLTTRPGHRTIGALRIECSRRGLHLSVGRTLHPDSAVVLQWGFDDPRARIAIRRYCENRKIPFLNPKVYHKGSQAEILREAGVRVPRGAVANCLIKAEELAGSIGYPVILKPLLGMRSKGVVLVDGLAALRRTWRPGEFLVQEYIPEGNRCTRVLIVDDKIVHAVTRVARDGLRATYAEGRMGTLETFEMDTRSEEIVLTACRALGLGLAGVDLVSARNGPVVLEVNHRIVDLLDRSLHGRRAIRAVAEMLWRECRRSLEAEGFGVNREAPLVSIVTGLSSSPIVAAAEERLRSEGLPVHVGRELELRSSAVICMNIGWRHLQRVSREARSMGIPLVNGAASTLGQQRDCLCAGGVPVPRTRRGAGPGFIQSAVRRVGGFAWVLADGDPECWATLDPAENPEVDGRILVEERLWSATCMIRCWVHDGQVALTQVGWPDWSLRPEIPDHRIVDGTRWHSIGLRQSEAGLAIAACRALNLQAAIVEVIPGPEPAVTRVLHRNLWSEDTALQNALARSLASAASRLAMHAEREIRSNKPITVLVPRPIGTGPTRRRIWAIQALHTALVRRQNAVVYTRKKIPRDMHSIDLILQDPLESIGNGLRTDGLNDYLFARHPGKTHLLRSPTRRIGHKREMAKLARRLAIRCPALYRRSQLTIENLPIIAKPVFGSLGLGIRLVTKSEQLTKLNPARFVFQQFIDSGTDRAVSIRAVTVGDEIVSAAVFHNSRDYRSNLARGGGAIALTGPGRNARLLPHETSLLKRIGIEPHSRRVPSQVKQMAGKIGRHYARRGVQMLGQDFVVDAKSRWYFIEVNTAFGLAVFNVTDGNGTPTSRGVVGVAGRVLAEAFERRSDCRRGGSNCARAPSDAPPWSAADPSS